MSARGTPPMRAVAMNLAAGGACGVLRALLTGATAVRRRQLPDLSMPNLGYTAQALPCRNLGHGLSSARCSKAAPISGSSSCARPGGYAPLAKGATRLALNLRSDLEPGHPIRAAGRERPRLGVEIVLEVDPDGYYWRLTSRR